MFEDFFLHFVFVFVVGALVVGEEVFDLAEFASLLVEVFVGLDHIFVVLGQDALHFFGEVAFGESGAFGFFKGLVELLCEAAHLII